MYEEGLDMQKITKENFGEYEKKVWKMERRHKIVKSATFVATVAFCITAPFAPALMFFMTGLAEKEELSEFMSKNADALFIRFLSAPMIKLCSIFVPNGCPWPRALLFSILSVIFLFLIVYLVTAMIVGTVYAGKSLVPLEGSDMEKSEKLYDRYRSVWPSVYMNLIGAFQEESFRPAAICAIIFCGYFVIEIVRNIPYEISNGMFDSTDLWELLFAMFVVCIIGVVFFFIYAALYSICLCVSLLFYNYPRRNVELGNALHCYFAFNSYIDFCKKEEQRLLQAEGVKITEQDRRRGDELYRQATAHSKQDEDLIQQAADFGCRPACRYMAWQMFEKYFSGSYTWEKKEDIAKMGMAYFNTAFLEEGSLESKAAADFGYQVLRYEAENLRWDFTKGEEMISHLRTLQDSELLSERLQKNCSDMISTIQKDVDRDREYYRKRSQLSSPLVSYSSTVQQSGAGGSWFNGTSQTLTDQDHFDIDDAQHYYDIGFHDGM